MYATIPGHFSGKVLLGCIECEIWFSAFGGLVSRSKSFVFLVQELPQRRVSVSLMTIEVCSRSASIS